jgi:pyruvate,orthophosphate dikinase
MMQKWVYSFGDTKACGNASQKSLLGGKGANLAEMSALGLPVPHGFTITTEACVHYFKNNDQFPQSLMAEVETAMADLEKSAQKSFGSLDNPLLVSVRSGAQASMPGMMDTVLNLGLNNQTVEAIGRLTGNRRFALDCYRRFITMYSNVVLGLSHHHFENILDDHKDRLGISIDTELTDKDWDKIIRDYHAMIKDELEIDFPQDPKAQLWGAIEAVFRSWMNDRAKFYRKMHSIPEDWGTAVNIQSMVFGNMGETSATGVAFTRDPSTGENRLYGEFLKNAQGEDVVAGIRTPQSLTKAAREAMGDRQPSMEEAMPEVFAQFQEIVTRLETHYRDVQDVEFTVEQGKLFMLQTRSAKRTSRAALKIAVDMATEGLITREEALLRIDPLSLDQLLHPMIDPSAEKIVIAKGLPASPGAASGKIAFTADEAVRMAAGGEDVILVRDETSPEDIHGMHAARAIVTARGGMTSHAAVVARGMGRPCVSGTGTLLISVERAEMSVGGHHFKMGDILTIDGSTGEIIKGAVRMIEPEFTEDFDQIMKWADGFRRLKIRANAETPLDAKTALGYGAEGIGLCRTEHMFFDDDRITAVREMILADDQDGRKKALEKILPMQKADFYELFVLMRGLPVTIRLLDPPLHEFLPHTNEEIEWVALQSGMDCDKLRRRTKEMSETNPMLGWRGCRLGVTFPEIYESQIQALFEAALEAKAQGFEPSPEIMHPLVSSSQEMEFLTKLTHRVAQETFARLGAEIPYDVGTMIELPRAALVADELAQHARFFSFGTNDLTQTTLGISRDDAGRFLNHYLEKGIYQKDPFVSLDVDGVGQLIKIAFERGRATRPDLKLGICGEHGGDPASIAFCEAVGLDYVSCSPYRVPVARLAAAQAAIRATIQ